MSSRRRGNSSAVINGDKVQNDVRSHGLWEASAPPAPPTAQLRSTLTADAVIVGAGFTGLSAALHLAVGGLRVVVIEANEIGFGGSGRNVGLVNAGMWATPSKLLAALGDRHGPRLIEQLGAAPRLVFELIGQHKIDCQPVCNGTLHCAVGNRGLRDIEERARQWQSLGAPVELLDAKHTSRAVGTGAYSGSLLDRRAGTIQPLAYARGLAHAARLHGASIFTATQVTQATDLGTRWKISTAGGSVTAPWVIVATNAYSEGKWGCLRKELVRLPYFNLATRPLDPTLRRQILPEGHGAWDTRQVLSSLRLDATGRLIFGSVGALRGTGLSIHRDWGRRSLRKLFPPLRDVEFDYEWYGWIGMTTDSLPRFHRLGRNMFSFSGYNGRGIAPGTSFGRDLASLVSGQVDEADLSLPLTQCEAPTHRVVKEFVYELGSQIVHAVGART